MKDIFRKGFFAVLVTLLVGFVCIPENSTENVQGDLSNQVETEQSIDLVSVDYAVEVSTISTQSNQSEPLLIASLNDFQPVILHSNTTFSEMDLLEDGIRDETLSSDYWIETNQLAPRFRPMIYFT